VYLDDLAVLVGMTDHVAVYTDPVTDCRLHDGPSLRAETVRFQPRTRPEPWLLRPSPASKDIGGYVLICGMAAASWIVACAVAFGRG
jgi:hypothetical protein